MASIRNMGTCPCPRCKIPLSNTHLVGSKQDRRDRRRLVRLDDDKRQYAVSAARRAIYESNFAVNSAYVERQLQAESLVPTAASDHIVTPSVNLTS